MPKSCCAIGCTERSLKDSTVSLYRFPADKERRKQLIQVVKRDNWEPTKSTRICSKHFVSGAKSNDPLSPDYVPSVFSFVDSPIKRKRQRDMHSGEKCQRRAKCMYKSHLE